MFIFLVTDLCNESGADAALPSIFHTDNAERENWRFEGQERNDLYRPTTFRNVAQRQRTSPVVPELRRRMRRTGYLDSSHNDAVLSAAFDASAHYKCVASAADFLNFFNDSNVLFSAIRFL